MSKSGTARQSIAAGAGVVALAYGLGALAVARGPGAHTTYAGSWRVAAALAVAAGLGLIGAGLVVWAERPSTRVGALAVLAGAAWFAPFWAGWEDGPPLPRSLALVAAGFALPLLVHMVLAFPGGRLQTAPERALVAVVYAEAVVSALGRALLRDPFLDPRCWDNCTDNAFLVHASPGLADAIRPLDLWFAATAAGGLTAVCVWRLVAVTSTARHALGLVLTAGILLGAATIARTVALARTSLEDPFDPVFRWAYVAGCIAVLVLALGLAWSVGRVRRQQRAVARIVTELGAAPQPGSLEPALARAIGDPGLRIAYWLPASSRYADAFGTPVDEPTAEPPRRLTSLVRDESLIAVVVHGGEVSELESTLGASVRLALENERLQAEVLAQLVDLRASRGRIVETGDAERRRLERNLHDGAQQRLLALSYDIRLARAAAGAEGGTTAASLLDEASTTVQAALEELRDLARGIHPAILTEAGLTPALATLADTAQLAVELEESRGERYPPGVETAAYLTVVEALDDAIRRGAGNAGVSVSRVEGSLLVLVEDDGTARTAGMTRLSDRVGALGGRLDLGATTVGAEIPLAVAP